MAIIFKVLVNAPLVASPGALLAGAWINLVLYSIEFLVGSYFICKVNQKKIKILVAVAILIDTLGTICVCQYTWVALLTPQKPLRAIAEPFLLGYVMSMISAAIEQSYFTHRVWTITRRKTMVSILAVLIFVPVVCNIASMSIALKVRDPYEDQDQEVTLTIVATLLVAITDIFIALYLVFKLRSINLVQFSCSTKHLIRKIMTYTVACGFITAGFTIVTTTLSFISVEPFLVFFACNGRVYTLTILLNFLLFHRWRQDPGAKRRSSSNGFTENQYGIHWKGSIWSRRFGSSQSSTVTPRYPPSALRRSRSSVSVVRTEIHGAVHGAAHETFQRPVAGPPFSMESIFTKSEEDLVED
ncbi:hypothetical protein FB446DRAFT_748960 [Lentinula raphanica]|nr:hypothetical protein FB446DRAFT_748960 [Lentinula raphanica]